MTTTIEHYEHHLAPIYLCMAGGPQVALQAGRDEVDALALPLSPGSSVVDLGAGFGMHAIPLAQAGASIVAIDSTALLLLRDYTVPLLGDQRVIPVRSDDTWLPVLDFAFLRSMPKEAAPASPDGATATSSAPVSPIFVGDIIKMASPPRYRKSMASSW